MKRSIFSLLIFLSSSLASAESVGMYTTWLVDRDKATQDDVLNLMGLGIQGQSKPYGITSLLESASTRYYWISLTTTTNAESVTMGLYSISGKIFRAQDQWTHGNGMGEMVYPYPAEYRDYSVKVSS